MHKIKCLGGLTFSMQTKYGRAKGTASPQTKNKNKTLTGTFKAIKYYPTGAAIHFSKMKQDLV